MPTEKKKMAVILIVEDDSHISNMLQATFIEEGYEVLAAFNGVEGLVLFNEHQPDLVVTDILMPQKEGLSLIADIRQQSAEARIIAISGGALNLQAGCNLELARLFGADCTFHKPLDIDAMLTTVANLLA